MNRINRKFQELKKKRKKAFIVFITAGYPNIPTTEKLILQLDKIGVDIVEIGVPFSDPIADGPIIQEASAHALKRKVNLNKILALVKNLRKRTQIPICLMSYYNPIFCFGVKKFINKSIESGIDGLIIPDLAFEEGTDFIGMSKKAGLNVICFISPTSSRERIRKISKLSGGFIYYVSLTGITGARKKIASDLAKNLNKIKRITKKPVCVGFGISTREQVRAVKRIASGVIVGSAVISKIKESMGNKKDLVRKVSKFILDLKNV